MQLAYSYAMQYVMSERWGTCSCSGSDCLVCGGTGFTGDVAVYLKEIDKIDWERERYRPRYYSLTENRKWILEEEQKLYSGLPKTKSIELAVSAINNYIQEQKKKKESKKMQFRDDITSEGSKNFLRLKQDKESVVGVFQGNPYDFRQHWIKNGQTSKSEICSGDGCKFCADGLKAVFRFRLNFVMYDQQQGYYPKIFEQGLTVYESLRALHKDYPLNNTVVRITRNGTGNNTTYMVLPVPGQVIDEAKKQKLSAVKLHDLAKVDEPQASGTGDFNSMNESDIPF